MVKTQRFVDEIAEIFIVIDISMNTNIVCEIENEDVVDQGDFQMQ